VLVPTRRCCNDWNFSHINQQLGTRRQFPIAPYNKENSEISRIYSCPGSKKAE
jgi:hypothetical protein